MAKKKVLIVDDSVYTVHLFKEIVEFGGYSPLTAFSGLEALDLVHQFPIDCILLDVMMPGIDGISVCKSIKRDKNTKHIPIIFITAFHDNAVHSRCFDAGADAFLAKPIDNLILLETIEKLITDKN